MNLGNISGTASGIQLINGKIKPKFGFGAIISISIITILLVLSIIGFIYCIFNFNVELFVACILGII